MKNKLLAVVLAAAFVGLCTAVPVKTNEEDARRFVQRVDRIILSQLEQASAVMFEMEDIPSANAEAQNDRILNAAEYISDIVRASLKYDTTQFKDKELKYSFEQIKLIAEETVIGRFLFEILVEAVNDLEALGDIRNITNYSNEKKKLRYFPTVHNIIAQSNNTKELEYYWSSFRENNFQYILRRLTTVTRLMIDAAKETEMTAVEFWMKGYNLTEMERLMNETRPLYVQLHAFIRNQLVKKYGDSVIKVDGPIPDHLFQQVLAQAWTNGSIIDDMFPYENLPAYNKILKQKNFNSLDLYKSANEFYRSLGLESTYRDLFKSRIKIRRDREAGDCKPIVNDFTIHVSMRVCKKMDFRAFLQAHGNMARIYYAMQKKNLPSYYQYTHNLDFPVGEAVVLSASTFSHLKTIGLIPDVEITDELQFNRLLRMAIHTLLNIPVHYVHTKTMADLFEGKVGIPLLNKHYWSLMDQFVGVEPPNDRLSGTFDFSFKFYTEINDNRQAKKFYSEILGYQMYKRLCQISGKYDHDKLYNCDFYGSKEVGDALKNLMNLGSSKPVNKVLETIFPDNTTVTADSLLEYYSPIQSWLEQKNQEEKVTLGWTHSTKVIERVKVDSDKQ